MKKFSFSLLLLLGGIVNGQVSIDSLIPNRSFQVFATDSTICRNYTDSIRYIFRTRSDNDTGRLFEIGYDSIFTGFSISSEHSSFFFKDDGLKKNIINLIFHDGTTVPKEFYHRDGSVVRIIQWDIEGTMIDFFECNYAECDACMREIFDTSTKLLKRRVLYKPFGCYENLDLLRLREDLNTRKAIPYKSIDFINDQVATEKDYSLEYFYVN